MDSNWFPNKRPVVAWADLPPDLLSMITGRLENASDITRLRSVCRSWRLSISPSPNKISRFFPCTLQNYRPDPHHPYLTRLSFIQVQASSVYLVRSRLDPSEACMVSMQEPAVAKRLVLCHALTRQSFSGGVSKLGAVKEVEISRSYSHNERCRDCNALVPYNKVAFLASGGCDQLVGLWLCKERSRTRAFRRFRLGCELTQRIDDIVEYKGRIYAVGHGSFYVFDHTKLELIRLDCGGDDLRYLLGSKKRLFVVSDGDLYIIVLKACDDPPECYRLVVDDVNAMLNTQCKWEKVEGLGDKVFFVARDCSFAVSARDLPRPWKGNCIVYVGSNSSLCLCSPKYERRIMVLFHFGDGDQPPQFTQISSLRGYSDLFVPFLYRAIRI